MEDPNGDDQQEEATKGKAMQPDTRGCTPKGELLLGTWGSVWGGTLLKTQIREKVSQLLGCGIL